MEIAEKVAEGAKLLDRVRPNWPREFDQVALNFRTMGKSILDQIFGSRIEGVRVLGIRLSETANYGFDLDGTVWYASPKWSELRDAWLSEAKKRLTTLATAN